LLILNVEQGLTFLTILILSKHFINFIYIFTNINESSYHEFNPCPKESLPRAQRLIQFCDITNCKPIKSNEEISLTHGNIKRISSCDHTTYWYGPGLEPLILTEPYSPSATEIQNEITDKTDILYLGLSTCDQNDPIKRAISANTLSSPLNRTSYIGGFFGYIITRKGAATLLEYISKNGIRHGIDYLPKIIPTLNCIVAQPNIVFSEVVHGNSVNQDSNIQLDHSTFDFDAIQKSKDDWEFVSGKDIIGNDLLHAGYKTPDEYFERAYFTPSCVAFNTLGFFKHTIGDFTESPYFKSSDGIYVKKNAKQNKFRIKLHVLN
jgi:GR25 family glycosyltransferase involved in LPS biosynthesis